MKSRIIILVFLPILLLVLVGSCKKSNSTNKDTNPVQGLHIDNRISADYGANRTLLFVPGGSGFIGLSTGKSTGGHTFRLMNIDKNFGLKSFIDYHFDAKYTTQSATCADADKAGNIWVGGFLQSTDTSYSKPFLVKLDKNGQVLQSVYYPIYHNIYYQEYYSGHLLKVLSNGDLAYVVTMGYDIILMRLKNTGEVLWMKRYITPGDRLFLSDNMPIIEDAKGNLAFLVSGFNVTYLFKTDGSGNMVFQRVIPEQGYSGNLYALSTGELLITGENEAGGPQQDPYLIKINPADGTVLQSRIMTGMTNSVIANVFKDIQEVNGQLRFIHTSDFQYNTISMDMNLNVVKIQRTLTDGGQSFGYSLKLYFDLTEKAIYHLIDFSGPSGGGGFQFLKTDMDGKSCHTDPGVAKEIPLADAHIQTTAASFTPNVPDMIPKAINFTVQQVNINAVSKTDGCTE